MSQAFFVSGATGAQGGYVARQLLEAGQEIHVIARNPESDTARDLAAKGANVFRGDFDIDSMEQAAKGCIGAFINVSPVFTDPQGEIRHMNNVLEACRKAGVKTIVQSSVSGLDRIKKEDLGSLGGIIVNKVACEKAVMEASGFESWTIIRYARLLNSFVLPFSAFLFPTMATEQTIKTAWSPDHKQAVLDPIDVGRAAKNVLLDESGKFKNMAFYLAHERRLTYQDIVDLMNAAPGEPKVKLHYYSEAEIKQLLADGNPTIAAEIAANEKPASDDLGDASRLGIALTDPSVYFVREVKLLRRALGEN